MFAGTIIRTGIQFHFSKFMYFTRRIERFWVCKRGSFGWSLYGQNFTLFDICVLVLGVLTISACFVSVNSSAKLELLRFDALYTFSQHQNLRYQPRLRVRESLYRGLMLRLIYISNPPKNQVSKNRSFGKGCTLLRKNGYPYGKFVIDDAWDVSSTPRKTIKWSKWLLDLMFSFGYFVTGASPRDLVVGEGTHDSEAPTNINTVVMISIASLGAQLCVFLKKLWLIRNHASR